MGAKAIKLGSWDKPSLTWFSKFVNLLVWRKLTEIIMKVSSFGSTLVPTYPHRYTSTVSLETNPLLGG